MRSLICQSFHTIIIDNRGYEAHQDLIPVNNRLLKFVEDGGTLLVFYHRTNEWNPNEQRGRPQLAPYPIIIGDERVTEEDAPVTFLQPRHPLLNFPNRITQTGFRELGSGTRALLSDESGTSTTRRCWRQMTKASRR